MRRIEEALRRTAGGVVGAARVRLTLHADGRTEVEATALPLAPARTLQVGLAARPVDPRSIWLFHKTTRREVYDEAAASRPDCDDVLLWNDRRLGELTAVVPEQHVVAVGPRGRRLVVDLAPRGLVEEPDAARVDRPGRRPDLERGRVLPRQRRRFDLR